MSSDKSHIDFARGNEDFAGEIRSEYSSQKNWVITIQFYSLLHYVEECLQSHGYESRSHKGRKQNIKKCKHVDNRMRRLYRRLEDISRDARYECMEMEVKDIEKSEETLEEGKEILGVSDGGGSTKYTV